ncbi:acetolactate decarboxylase [Pseudanabaena sp. PCC 6802]|uniref:acetolactate decarboxylase n=1 Tax=Pseudanabaena sp. PCC 6802 TaxID=118173 RepID=UPI000378CEC0|nr:acetolactate decarboxylase [Pseudanabaena sp. PCC 6802]
MKSKQIFSIAAKLKSYLWFAILFIAIALGALPIYSQQILQLHPGFQVSTLGALNVGVYEGTATLAALKQHGDFGLGTFDGLEGEMIVLNGTVYQVKVDGVAYHVSDGLKTPFSTVTFFRRDRSLRLTGKMNYQELQQQIDKQLPTQNLPYAVRIQGAFPYLKVRSVPKQALPYPPLNDVVKKQQRIFELRNVRGTLVGFRLPQYLKSVNVAGYHFHFITSDRKAGGHLIDGEFSNPVADVETLRDWAMLLPDHSAFAQASLD